MRYCSPRNAFLATTLFLALTPALADDAGLLRCRAITDASARLACYDALPIEGKAGQAKAMQTPEQFGMEPQAAAAQTPVELDAIESRILGHFDGWRPNMAIPLANGQVWQVTDGSSRFYDLDEPKVMIKRGAFGAFFLNIDGDNRTVRVKRVR